MISNRPAIPQTDPKANYLAHKAEIDAAIARVLDSGRYILGREVAAFEAAFAAYIGMGYAIGVASGTAALEIALRACDVGPGDVVFTVSHTAVATVAAIELVGATPVLVDVDPATFTMDPHHLQDTIEQYSREHRLPAGHGRLKAILPVHLYGHPADMPAIVEIAQRYGLHTIEDCAQSHGAMLDGRRTGAWGDIAAFSFYPTKNLGGLGDGGMVVTGSAELAERARLLRQYGWRRRYVSEMAGTNSRLDELQAAILGVKLRYLDAENERRRAIAERYTRLLAGTRVRPPSCGSTVEHAYHQYVVRAEGRDGLRGHLQERGIGTLVHYPQPVHLQPAYAGRLQSNGTLAHSERAAAQVLSLPMYPELPAEGVARVAGAVQSWPGCDDA